LSVVSASELATGPDRAWITAECPAVKGTMLWFDEAKDYGFLLTDGGERLRVDRDDFIGGAAPVGRCAQRPVSLSVGERKGEPIAIEVSLVREESQRRARRHTSSIRSAWS